jgi:predicted RNA-binding protein with PUA-like domain
MKSEPSVFSVDDLARAPGAVTHWDGVRNYQARNLMRDGMRVGDRVLFYHSSAEETGVAAIAEIAREAYPDPSQFDARSKYHDPGSPKDAPRWLCVDVRLVRKLPRVVRLEELRAHPGLAAMEVLRRGNRLSVQPVTAAEFAIVEALAAQPGAPEGAAANEVATEVATKVATKRPAQARSRKAPPRKKGKGPGAAKPASAKRPR